MTTLALALALWQTATAPVAPDTATTYPFAVGEELVYDAKIGFLKMGQASLEVLKVDTVRGQEVFVFQFRLWGKTPFYDVDDRLVSYTTTDSLASLRFVQDFKEDDDRHFEIYPAQGFYRQLEEGDTTHTTPAIPLDDTSFFYFLRTTPLKVGETYSYDRYFKPEKNPIQIEVLEREKMELPDGREVPVLVLHPVVNQEGKKLFSPDSDTRMWITDDARRIPVQIRAKFPFGTVTLQLEEMRLPDLSTTTAER